MTNKTVGERHNRWQVKPDINKIMTLGDFISALESYELPASMDKDFFKSQLERMKNAEKLSRTIKKKDVLKRAEKWAEDQNFACTEKVIEIVENDMKAEALANWGFLFDEKTGTLVDNQLLQVQKAEDEDDE